jgi:hypothetical protein
VPDLLDSALVSALRDGLDKITGGVASLRSHVGHQQLLSCREPVVVDSVEAS